VIARRASQPRGEEPLMTWRTPRLSRRAHVILSLVVAAGVLVIGTFVIGGLIRDDLLAFGITILWGVTVGMVAVAYWEEVIDR
jgi:hypothetical protein